MNIDENEEAMFILPVNPAGSSTLRSECLDTFAKDVAVSYSSQGRIRSWTATLDFDDRTANWLCTSLTETGIVEASLVSASPQRKGAVVDSSRAGLTIWDLRNGQIEHEMHYSLQDLIQDLDWSSTPDDQSMLAVGFPHSISILAQMRFDYINKGPAWALIRTIQIGNTTSHPIGDSTWLGNGHFVIGVGHQLLLYDEAVVPNDEMVTDLAIPAHEHRCMDLFKLVNFLNGPLPVFHPQFMTQCILTGKTSSVRKIIIGLRKAIRYYESNKEIDSFVGMSPSEFFEDREVRNPLYLSELY